MFLRENRFKLMANGVKPPASIFRSNSYANIDMKLVANWLIRLTPEQHERFNQLRDRFSAEMEERETIQDMEDAQLRADEETYLQMREQQDWQRGQLYLRDVQARQAARAAAGTELPAGVSLDVAIAREKLEEIAAGKLGKLKPGHFGRDQQWSDPEFPAIRKSLGNCAGAQLVKKWKEARAINIDSDMFKGGTDPDDVHQGLLHDGWLLSAIQILTASGGEDDEEENGEVDPLIADIFVQSQSSTCGAYAVRLFKNGQWETVIVDDYFPCLADNQADSTSAGAAFAHSEAFEETWIAILEKAFAKYHGSYAALEHGFTHFALEELTGGEADAISIALASRGANKRVFWSKLKKYKRNRYLMGAGSVAADTADKELQDTGLVFGAVYTILRVVEIEGNQLIQLRNPPGNHGEWQGDWGDNSSLWNCRLKALLNLVDDEEDGCFWMSFDDFCHSFRHLYVCRYFDPDLWSEVKFVEHWRQSLGTAQGLPSKHSPDCKLEENPQFAIAIDRPTDVVITMSQTDNGLATGEPIEAALYLVETPKHLPKRSILVKELTMKNVVAWSGDPIDERQLSVFAALRPGTYTVLCAAYKSGDEGPFTLSIRSNYPIRTNQLWPPLWKKQGKDGPELTMKQKMLEKGKVLAAKAQEKAAEMAEKAKIAAQKKLAEQRGEKWEPPKVKRMETQEERDFKAATELKNKWKEKTDASGNTYFFNKETSVSTFDRPEGLLPKAEYKSLKKKVEEIQADDDLEED
jgi:hypothetical protein